MAFYITGIINSLSHWGSAATSNEVRKAETEQNNEPGLSKCREEHTHAPRVEAVVNTSESSDEFAYFSEEEEAENISGSPGQLALVPRKKAGDHISERTENSSTQSIPHPISEATAAKVVSMKPQQWWDLPALVVGVWQPGVPGQAVTLALTPHSKAIAYQNFRDLSYRSDIVGDIMKVPNEDIGQRKYRMIVFQGVCPVATAMGATPCNADEEYEKVDPEHLAWKLKGLISEEGGFIFIRHCCQSANIHGIGDPEQRQHFIRCFQKRDIKQLSPNDLHPPCLVTQHAPDVSMPDSAPHRTDKWDSENGAMIFFSPKYKV